MTAGDQTNLSSSMLYKLYQLRTAQDLVYLTRAIQLGVIWAGPPSGFNDPFDCRPTFHRSTDPAAVKKYFAWMTRTDNKQLSESEVERRATDLAIRYVAGDERIHLEEENLQKRLLRRLDSEVGVACFTSCYKNVVMWSHYASQHRGACIEVPDNAELFEQHSLVTVTYESDDRPALRLLEYDGSEESAVNALKLCYTHKAKSWAYEQERRAIRYNGPGPLDLPEGAVKAVTLGALMEQELKAAVIRAARTAPNPVAVYQAKLSTTKYEIERELVLP